MSRITSKLQLTLPKALANRFHIRSGDEIDWQDAGDTIRIVPHSLRANRLSVEMRLHLFDEATKRQRGRQARNRFVKKDAERSWTREELHRRGRAD